MTIDTTSPEPAQTGTLSALVMAFTSALATIYPADRSLGTMLDRTLGIPDLEETGTGIHEHNDWFTPRTNHAVGAETALAAAPHIKESAVAAASFLYARSDKKPKRRKLGAAELATVEQFARLVV